MSRIFAPLGFFIFILGIIFLADTDENHPIFLWMKDIPYYDKISHMLLFGMFAFLLNYGLRFKSIKVLGLNLQLGALIVLTFAGLEELSQHFIPSRTLDIKDFIADIIGVVVFSYLHRIQEYAIITSKK
jgi:VanZ family protein